MLKELSALRVRILMFFITFFCAVFAQNDDPPPGMEVAIHNATSFCLMMPPLPGQDIAFVERESIAGCWNSPPGASAGREIPYGFITAAHYVKTPAFVQITGTYNPYAYNLSPQDLGTQLDNSLLSQGGVLPESGCADHPAYLEYIGAGVFCLRCCNYAFSNYCNPSNDTIGCRLGIPGNYGPGFDGTFASVNDPLFGSNPNPPVLNGNNCYPGTDTCATPNYVCCRSKSVNTNNGTKFDRIKTTCQYRDDCVEGTTGSLINYDPPVPPGSNYVVDYTAPPVNTFLGDSSQISSMVAAGSTFAGAFTTPASTGTLERASTATNPSQNSATGASELWILKVFCMFLIL